MYTIEWLRRLCGLLMVLMLLLTASQAGAQTLHGTDGENQVMGEMKTKLGKALSTGDVSACQREGENLALYGMGAQGEALIARDMASVQRRLDAIRLVYKSHYDLRTLNNKKSVKQAYKLISKLQDKLTEDALDDVSMVFVPAHSVSSKIALELYIATKDVYGHNSDAGELVDSAKALKELDRLVKNSDEKMKKMIPEAKNLERVRTFLIDCHAAFKSASGSSKPGATVPSQQPARPRNVQGDWVMTSSSDGGNCNGTVVSIDQTADGSIRGIETHVTCERGVATGKAVGTGFRWANADTLAWAYRYATRSVDRLHDGNSSLTFLSGTVARETSRDSAGNEHWGEYRRR